MSVTRPDKDIVELFLQTQQQKKNTVFNWTDTLPHMLTLSAFTMAFSMAMIGSLNPTGIVPRILYEKTIPKWQNHLRHLSPALILVAGMFYVDYRTGLWSPNPYY